MLLTIIIFSVFALVVIYFAFPRVILRDRIHQLLHPPKNDVEASLRLLERDPSNIAALEHLAAVSFSHKDYSEAYAYYSQLVVKIATVANSVPLNCFQVYLNFGISAYHLGIQAEALTSLQKAKLLMDNNRVFDLFYYLGLIYYERENYLEASSMLHVAHEQSPGHKEANTKLAFSYYRMGNFSQALALFEELSDMKNPRELEFSQCMCLVELGKQKEALNCLAFVSQNQDYALRCWYQMAKIYLAEQANDKALEACERIIDFKDLSSVAETCFAYYQSARLQAGMGFLDEATERLGTLLKIKDSYRDAAILQKRYNASKDCPQLFRLLEGDDDARREVARRLTALLVPHASGVKIISEQQGMSFESSATSAKDGNKYYIWASFQDTCVSLRQVFDTYQNKKSYNHCIMASLSGFEEAAYLYTEGRPIVLLEGAELKKYISRTLDHSP